MGVLDVIAKTVENIDIRSGLHPNFCGLRLFRNTEKAVFTLNGPVGYLSLPHGE